MITKRIRTAAGLAAAGLLAVAAVVAGATAPTDQVTSADSMWGFTAVSTPAPTEPTAEPAQVDDSMWG
ncbi:hypothetical protein [Kitasatospora sp. NPDC088548]|uniref:hypothetical protein n=1 Tax=Kitasatospora sp. NPDC088548 TaxID=3364075 RepID=UPI0038026A2E